MKKIISIVLAMLLVFCFAGCEEKDSANTTFRKPEQYASVVMVTINPQFYLYLDEAGAVLAIEAANDDAKSIEENISLENKEIQAVVDDLISAANEGGFLKPSTTVQFEITEVRNAQVDTEQIFDRVVQATNRSCKKLEIEVTINTSVAEDALSSAVTSSEPKSSSNATTVTSKQTGSASVSTSAPTKASSTVKPSTSSGAKAKCMHDYAAATCTAPQTCKRCGHTQGTVKKHTYTSGKCTVCGIADPNYSTTIPADFYGKYVAYVTDHTPNSEAVAEYILTLSADENESGIIYTGYEEAEKFWPDYSQEHATYEDYLQRDDIIDYKGTKYIANIGDGDSVRDLVVGKSSLSFEGFWDAPVTLHYVNDNGVETLTAVCKDQCVDGAVFEKVK